MQPIYTHLSESNMKNGMKGGIPITIISLDTTESFDDFHSTAHSSKYCVLPWVKIEASGEVFLLQDNFTV